MLGQFFLVLEQVGDLGSIFSLIFATRPGPGNWAGLYLTTFDSAPSSQGKNQ